MIELLLRIDPGEDTKWYTVDHGHWYTGFINWITAFLEYPGDTLVVVCIFAFLFFVGKHNL